MGKLLSLDSRTVKKYKQIEGSIHSERGYHPSLIDPFAEELQKDQSGKATLTKEQMHT